MRARSLPLRWLVVAALAAAGAGAVVASAEGDDRPTVPPAAGPAREEIESLARDAGVSSTAAERLLAQQRRLPQLDAAARQRLGPDLGGLWVDGEHRIVVAVRRDALARRRAAAVAAVAQAGLADAGVRIVASRHDERTLLDLQHAIDARLPAVNRGARIAIEVEPDVRSSRVRLRVPRAARMTGRQAAAVAGWRRRHPDLLWVTPDAQPLLRR